MNAIETMVQQINSFPPSQHVNPSRHLTPSQVSDIRHRYAKGKATQAALAKEYGVDRKTVERLINGKTYKDCA